MARLVCSQESRCADNAVTADQRQLDDIFLASSSERDHTGFHKADVFDPSPLLLQQGTFSKLNNLKMRAQRSEILGQQTAQDSVPDRWAWREHRSNPSPSAVARLTKCDSLFHRTTPSVCGISSHNQQARQPAGIRKRPRLVGHCVDATLGKKSAIQTGAWILGAERTPCRTAASAARTSVRWLVGLSWQFPPNWFSNLRSDESNGFFCMMNEFHA